MDSYILVTGAAGFVGTHVIYELMQNGYTTLALDNRQNALEDAANRLFKLTSKQVKTVLVDLLDKKALIQVFQTYSISHVIHLAGLKAVRESHGSPLAFYNINVIGTVNLLEVMSENKVYNIIFSSSSKVYNTPDYLPLDENHPVGECTNPYGRTKYMIEQILHDLAKAQQCWKVMVLRYFNPSGAHSSGWLGEDKTRPPVNIMPIICHVALGRRDHLTIYGQDYDTIDGTVVKAYTHVEDVARGHTAALTSWKSTENYRVYNIGSNETCSILGLVHIFQQLSGKQIGVVYGRRQEGEKAVCSVNSSKAYRELGWKPQKTLQQTCEDMWRWMSSSPDTNSPDTNSPDTSQLNTPNSQPTHISSQHINTANS